MGMVKHAQGCMPKETIKTLRSQTLKKVQSWFCACFFISMKVINWLFLSLGACGQACPDMPKEDFKTLISQKLSEV